jgi:D-glycero-D-manno-heptose 1,7-bisphosphate phosphatase
MTIIKGLCQGVIFDRDGVLNDLVVSPGLRSPRSLDELHIDNFAPTVIKELVERGFKCCAITNQPDITRKIMTVGDLNSINQAISRALPGLSEIYVCPHDNDDECDCRKPKIGLLKRAIEELNLDTASSWLVGDKWTDILAGKEAGLKTILIRNIDSWKPTSQGSPPEFLQSDFEVLQLSQITKIIN